jgi:hypothetical protein
MKAQKVPSLRIFSCKFPATVLHVNSFKMKKYKGESMKYGEHFEMLKELINYSGKLY